MKPTTHYLLLLLLLSSSWGFSQTENVVYPQNYDTKFQDVYVDGSDQGYAVGTCGVVVRTTDGGLSWQLVDAADSSFDFSAVTCPGDDCNNAVIAGDGIVLNRQANGRFTQDVRADFKEVLKLHQLDNNIVIADKNGRDYLRSTDNGQTWTTMALPDTDWQGSFLFFVDGLTGLAFDGDRYLHKTTDGGATWARSASPFGLSIFTMYWHDENTGWVQASDRNIYRTTNGGQSWSNLNVVNGPRQLLWLEAFSATHLVGIGLVEELWQSLDGGATWTRDFMPDQSGTRPAYYNYHRRGDEFFVPSDAAEIFYSATGFTNWEGQIPADRLSLTDIAFANDDVGIAAGTHSALLKTVDGGTTWTPLVSGNPNPNAPVASIDLRSADEFVLYYGNTYPRITTDGGNSFRQYFDAASGLGQGDATVFHNFANGDILVMGFSFGGISSDDGATWTVIDHGFDAKINGLYFPTETTGYAVGDGVLAKTTDAGRTWTEITNPSPSGRWQSVFFFDENRGMIGQSSRTGYLTTDGGASWTVRSQASAGAGYAYDAAADIIYSTTFETGNNGYLNRSRDRGDTWERVSRLCAAGGGLGLTPSGRFLYAVATGGHIERHVTANLTSNRSPRRAAVRLRTFPNPSSGQLTVSIPLTNQATHLEIFAADGRRVAALEVPAHTEQYRVQLAGERPGLYLFSWVSPAGARHTGRVVLR